ncbi:NAD-dependent epimerase/dehydratase family protein [Photobacterium kishitanii]|uniref:NAD-dependent epimerase/dehydratase family protein n=1 Tax=Photobacterium kishitanii TaxID=318456 RepID=UPI00043505EE|nr:NAD-dependent epimerase/dehydratase family protein [Photobacterium kishitanii]CEO38467.1 conserved hypothetical protein [Photobacterium kishitanii]
MNNLNVLVLGGTGAIGVYLVDVLLESGYSVDITSRKHNKSRRNNFNYIVGDGKNIKFFDDISSRKNYDCIIDLMLYTTKEFSERIDLLLSRTRHYIFVSTYRVFSDYNYSLINEESSRLLDVINDNEYLKTDEYALSKARQEDLLSKSIRKNWTIVRPSITYSTNRFQLGIFETDLLLSRAIRNEPVVLPRSLMDKYTTMTWAGDVAIMIEGLILKDKSFSDSFNVLTHKNYTWREVAQFYNKIIGLEVVEVELDDFLPIVTNPWQFKYDRMFNRLCDNKKILDITGINKDDIMSLEDGLNKELSLNREKKILQQYPVRVSGRIDRILNRRPSHIIYNVKFLFKYLVGRIYFIDRFFIKLGL